MIVDSQIIASVIGAIATIAAGIVVYLLSRDYYKHSRKMEQDRMMKELFTEFNVRYDKINNPLNKIARKSLKKWGGYDERKKAKYEGIIVDFFNICAEEYYWYKEGRLDEKIWKSWHKGMNDIYKTGEIIPMIWAEECKNGGYKSYYISSEFEIFNKA